ncbi:MAG: 50S ribosomal protein L18 [Chloroflexi bacterium]|nr:50S ribosomal protein L18 [Chloroflexota bacterium]|tara:strand:+ start:2250 stop:2606 length:357 start_codon:yes stop_codon:yes gene_type:complete
MAKLKTNWAARIIRHKRLRQTLSGTAEKPRLNVFRSSKFTYAQIIDDEHGHTLASANSRELPKDTYAKIDAAREVGRVLAERAVSNGVKSVVFDRGGYRYHGRVKALADGAREKGLEF